MCKIGILLLDRDFEHDIYELIKAFYPEGDIHSLYGKRRRGVRYLLYCGKKKMTILL